MTALTSLGQLVTSGVCARLHQAWLCFPGQLLISGCSMWKWLRQGVSLFRKQVGHWQSAGDGDLCLPLSIRLAQAWQGSKREAAKAP